MRQKNIEEKVRKTVQEKERKRIADAELNESGGNAAVHLLLEENEEKNFPEKRHERNRRTSKYNKSKRKIKKALNEYM